MFGGREVSKSVATLGLIAALMLGGCQPLEVDQVAQQSMIGLTERDILACLWRAGRNRAPGRPGDRNLDLCRRANARLWTAMGDPPQHQSACPLGGTGTCDVMLVMTNARVSQVGYAGVDGQALPLGQECLFSVEACVKAP